MVVPDLLTKIVNKNGLKRIVDMARCGKKKEVKNLL